MDILEGAPPHEEIGLRNKIRGHSLPMSTADLHLDRCDFLGRFPCFERGYRQGAGRLGLSVAQRARAERISAEDLARFVYRFDA
jgi:hypothetical protein